VVTVVPAAPVVKMTGEMLELRNEMIEIWNRYSQETGVILPSKNIFAPEA
jgi:hypothetical protein